MPDTSSNTTNVENIPTRVETASARAHEAIKADILSGALASGEMVTEGELAARLGISRTPVREALLRLEAEGLVRLYPKRGALIVPVTPAETHDVMQARLVIEQWAAGEMWARREQVVPVLAEHLARMRRARAGDDIATFTRHDREFHEAIVANAGNAILTRAYHGLRERQMVIVAASMRMSRTRLDSALAGHERMLSLLASGTRREFVSEVRAHAERAHDQVGGRE